MQYLVSPHPSHTHLISLNVTLLLVIPLIYFNINIFLKYDRHGAIKSLEHQRSVVDVR